MNDMKQKLARFLYGRYGVDELYMALSFLWAFLNILNMLLFKSKIFSVAISGVIFWAVYRSMSRKYDIRRRENAVFLKLWHPVWNYISYTRDRIRDRKTARYRKCSHCKAIVKLPNKKGKHTVVCPKCHERFNVRI